MAAAGGTITGRAGPLLRRARAALVLILTTLTVLLALAPQNAAASPGWEQILNRPTPDLGGIDFVSETEGWLTAGAGLLRTTDGGATWTEAAQLSGNDVDFANTGHGWLVGNDGAIYGTTDGGETWTPQESGTQVHLQQIVALGAQEAWAVGSWEGYSDAISYPIATALLHTTDGGESWNQVETPPAAWFEEIAFIGDDGWAWGERCTSEEPFCSGGALTSALLRTTDGGSDWELVDTGLPLYARNLDFVDENNGWLTASACVAGDPGNCLSDVYRTQDGGLTWDPVDVGSYGLVSALDFQDETTGWAVAADCGAQGCANTLLHTTDGGATWASSSMPATQENVPSLAGFGDSLYATGFGIALRARPDLVWQPMDHPALQNDDLAFVSPKEGYLLNRGSLMRTYDGGSTWERGGQLPIPTRSIEFFTTETGVAAGGDCGGQPAPCSVTAHRTTDGGLTWQQTFEQATQTLSLPELHSIPGGLAWFELGDRLIVSGDGGATWRDVGDDISGQLGPVSFIDHDQAWAASIDFLADAEGYQLRRSLNGGVTWQAATQLQPGSVSDIQFMDARHGWYQELLCQGMCVLNLLVTSDAGGTWERAALTEEQRFNDVRLADATIGWATSRSCDGTCTNVIWRTRDGGRTWQGDAEGEHLSGTFFVRDAQHAWLVSVPSIGFGGGPPSRTYLYSTAGSEVLEEPPDLPITGTDAPGRSAWVPFVALGMLGLVAAVCIAGVLAFRWRG